MKRLIILSIIFLVCMFTKAETWTDDNGTIWPFYAWESNNKKYATIYGPTGTIPNDLIIPSVVKSGEEEYIVLVIGANAFSGCTNLTSVTIPNSVSSIDTRAFQNCSNLISVTIPDDIYFIGSEAFEGTAWDNNLEDGLIYLNNVVYRYKGTMPDNTSIEIKEGTISISPNAFDSCHGLTSITIPNSVQRIGEYAFAGCI